MKKNKSGSLNNSDELRIPKYLCFLLENDRMLYLFVIILLLIIVTILYITSFSIYIDPKGGNLFQLITKNFGLLFNPIIHLFSFLFRI